MAGAIAAKFLPLPLAIVVAFISHFILDALPHYGPIKIYNGGLKNKKNHVTFFVLGIDFIVCLCLFFWSLTSGHYSWIIAGIVAITPDFAWIYKQLFNNKLTDILINNKLTKFHSKIQKSQTPPGGLVELATAAILFTVLV